jgi:pimeloyl-ACP methyl ester carboxylesterase
MSSNETNQNKVVSKDGTPIALQKTGRGSPLILIHGTGADHTRWTAVLPQLAEHFTVYAIDRRGHGASGDAPEYAFQREYEDIAAVAASIAGPIDILGHSFGAACLLGAAPLIPNLRRMILYEPPMLRQQHTPQRSEMLQRMDQAQATGDRETIVLILMNEMLQIPLAAIDKLRQTPTWAGQLAAAHTIPRELRSGDAYGENLDGLEAISAQTLFLLGGASLASFKLTTETLHNLLPNSQIVILPGQQHSAMLTAPDLFANEITRFLLE